jgi:hypothetical protein
MSQAGVKTAVFHDPSNTMFQPSVLGVNGIYDGCPADRSKEGPSTSTDGNIMPQGE